MKKTPTPTKRAVHLPRPANVYVQGNTVCGRLVTPALLRTSNDRALTCSACVDYARARFDSAVERNSLVEAHNWLLAITGPL